ncbi:MAG TPA: hypothetical protein PKA50_17160, partial [Gemmatimonadales bacterium]|nr:hypothetical protein [Gemmatimonadales bacterium]
MSQTGERLDDLRTGFRRLALASWATLRAFSAMDVRLFYSKELGQAALAAPPAIAQVLADSNADGVIFRVNVTGDGNGAGVQQVWVSYTGLSGSLHGTWRPIDLRQSDPTDPTLWTATLTAAQLGSTAPAGLRFMVQAAGGNGLVSMLTNFGAYYAPDVDPARPAEPAPGAPAPEA